MECDSYGSYTMPELARQVAGLMKLGQGLRLSPHVIDNTGLEGAFDFKLRFHLQLMARQWPLLRCRRMARQAILLEIISRV